MKQPPLMKDMMIDFFQHVLLSDENIQEKIKKCQGHVYFEKNETGKSNILIFSLKGLYELMISFEKTGWVNVNYTEFQAMLYQSDINAQLRQRGGKIETHLSTGKINKNLYRLIRTTHKNENNS